MDRKKVLVIGRHVSEFFCPLFKEIGEKYPIDLYLYEIIQLPRKQDEVNASFVSQIRFRTDLKAFSKPEILKALITNKFLSQFSISKSFKESLRESLVNNEVRPIFEKFDVINIQMLTSEALYFIRFIPAGKKVVLAFWGSDLFLNNDDYPYEIHKKAVERADSIIVHTQEMRNIFLAKFGRHLSNKVHTFIMVNNPKSLTDISDLLPEKPNRVAGFRKKFGIPTSPTIITVGHSAHQMDHHIRIINALSYLPEEKKPEVFLLIPMTYGIIGDYRERVEEACVRSGISYKILTEYMDNEDMVSMRLSSEILVRLSEYDAFSLSLCETIAARNIVISGSWLPYGKLRAAGVYFLEAEDFDQLPGKIADILQNKSGHFEKCKNNTDKVIRLFTIQKSPERMGEIFMN